jgi:hypothetical protein
MNFAHFGRRLGLALTLGAAMILPGSAVTTAQHQPLPSGSSQPPPVLRPQDQYRISGLLPLHESTTAGLP